MSKRSQNESRLVYSTSGDHICSQCGKPKTKCRCQAAIRSIQESSGKPGTIIIRRETKGRKGKGVTIIEGFGCDRESLKARAKSLKQLCGCGGSVTDKGIEIQGDQRQTIKEVLEQEGLRVKLSGG